MRRGAAAALCLLLACGPEGGAPPAGDPVSFTANDGVELAGELRGEGATAVILLHMFPADRAAWAPFSEVLVDEGYTVLTFDFRGYGDSGGERVVEDVWRDALASVRFVRSRGFDRIVLVGASMGGTAALIVAAREDLAGVATLSAPTSFMGLSIPPEAVELVQEPKLFLASQGDTGAAAAAQNLYASARPPKQVEVVEGGDHGIDLVGGTQAGKVRRHLLDFLAGL